MEGHTGEQPNERHRLHNGSHKCMGQQEFSPYYVRNPDDNLWWRHCSSAAMYLEHSTPGYHGRKLNFDTIPTLYRNHL